MTPRPTPTAKQSRTKGAGKHTPKLWITNVLGNPTRTVDEVAFYAGPNAAFIVRAVNAYEEMLYALKYQILWKMRDGSPCACPAGKNEEGNFSKGEMPELHSTACEVIRRALARATEGEGR